jgi:hypothetical protein
MNELLYARQKKERGYSVQDALSDADGSDNAIVIYEKDGQLHCSYSIEGGNSLELIGMIELGKALIVEQT